MPASSFKPQRRRDLTAEPRAENDSSRPNKPRDRVPFGPVPRLYQRIHDILARQIVAGELSPGAHLGETGIASQFGVSRAPVRQALAELENKGLIAKASGRGYTVREVGKSREPGVAETQTEESEQRLVSSPSWERIYSDVESEIAARIAFGTWRVNEAELARHYYVSRTVARDVVGRLQQCGIVRKDDRARWYAPALTPDHVGELYEMRWLLEPAALKKAAPNLPPGFISGMRAHLEEAIANAHELGGNTLDQLETELHITLLSHCGSQTLMQAITLPQSLLIAHRFLYQWTPRLFATEPFLPEHLAIVTHLEQGEVAEAADALDQHLRVSRERAIVRIEEIVSRFRPAELPYLRLLDQG